jgi:hypothetical protein
MGTSTLTKRYQARGRDNAIVGPEHRCSHPPNALDEVALRVQVKATHPISPLLNQIRPSSVKMTTIIKFATNGGCTIPRP